MFVRIAAALDIRNVAKLYSVINSQKYYARFNRNIHIFSSKAGTCNVTVTPNRMFRLYTITFIANILEYTNIYSKCRLFRIYFNWDTHSVYYIFQITNYVNQINMNEEYYFYCPINSTHEYLTPENFSSVLLHNIIKNLTSW